MRRRRRPQREIAFSFDSFLDVVANVVGVILRLILVAWVGARTYKASLPAPPPPPPALADPEPLPDPTDPREPQLARRRRDVDRQAGLAERVRADLASAGETARQLRLDMQALQASRDRLSSEREAARRQAERLSATALAKGVSAGELRRRSESLTAELEELRRLPRPGKVLRYRTPVSAPVQTEELMFECQRGRVALIDHGAMLAEVKRELRSKEEGLRTAFQVTDLTAPVGAFRLRYFVERERGPLDAPGVAPSGGVYRYGVSGWEVVPIQSNRGEAEEQALAAGSAFRSVTDALDPQQTAVTFWVYPDSFALYRRLRDYLHEKDVVVAGRPLPEGVPIASSRHGTTSRGR
ncbi:MAG: hypothetical protein U0797_04815 [Gemmataceae bacterium]